VELAGLEPANTNDYEQLRGMCASTGSPEHLMLVRPRDGCIEQAGDTNKGLCAVEGRCRGIGARQALRRRRLPYFLILGSDCFAADIVDVSQSSM
jgi:hypothetical protein